MSIYVLSVIYCLFSFAFPYSSWKQVSLCIIRTQHLAECLLSGTPRVPHIFIEGAMVSLFLETEYSLKGTSSFCSVLGVHKVLALTKKEMALF